MTADTILDSTSSETPFVLRTLGQIDQFHVNLRGFGVEVRPLKYSLEHGLKDTAPNDTSKQIEMQAVNDEKMF
jgi:UDP-glucose:glycoprotein glucosyltransferase